MTLSQLRNVKVRRSMQASGLLVGLPQRPAAHADHGAFSVSAPSTLARRRRSGEAKKVTAGRQFAFMNSQALATGLAWATTLTLRATRSEPMAPR